MRLGSVDRPSGSELFRAALASLRLTLQYEAGPPTPSYRFTVKLLHLPALFLVSLISLSASAEEIIVAVASNFVQPMNEIVEHFERATDHRVKVVTGSSGKLFAQIQHGAPFQLFFSADQDKPAALVKAGSALANSRFTYALGELALWSAQADLSLDAAALRKGCFNKLAIANSRLAPYGVAAVEVLKSLGLWDSVEDRLVRGESIAQTFQFVSTGNAELGFVALSQTIGGGGSRWRIPRDLHEPIRQDAVLLRAGAQSTAAREFLQFVRGETAASIMDSHGYRVPSGD